jgi:PhoH-like ATPase
VDLADSDTSHADLQVEAGTLERLSRGEGVTLSLPGLHANQYVRLLSTEGSKRSVLGRVRADGTGVQALHDAIRDLAVRPLNMEQHFALDALLDDSLTLVTLTGKAGTGKTLLALAAGMHRTCEQDAFARLLVARPILPMGRDVGFLPGSLEDKLHPWMQPIFDNLAVLLQPAAASHAEATQAIQRLLERGVLAVEPLTYIRGRTMARQYLIVDEAQNLTPLEMKTIATRAGEGTKLVLTGDPDQIDNPYIDLSSSGFNAVISRFLGEPMAAHVVLHKGERSALAERASDLL